MELPLEQKKSILENLGGLHLLIILLQVLKLLREFKKFLKYGDGFEKKMITLELYKEWEKKNQRNFDDWCDETNNDMFWFKRHGNEWKKFKEKFEIEVKVLKSKKLILTLIGGLILITSVILLF